MQTRSITPVPRRRQLAVLVSSCLALSLGNAHAQTAAPAQAPAAQPQAPVTAVPAAAPAKPVETVEPAAGGAQPEMQSVAVVAERPTSRIDRDVYDVKSDISTSNNSAADALANVPSVNVDPDGTVTLRGSTNVQIMVDGKPSAMLQGDNRGAALNSMPADDIESIEVINNPGAQFGNEGGGGPILNLVTRRNKRPGGMGNARANYGTAGRYNSGVSGTYNSGRLSFQGGMDIRHDGRNANSYSERERIAADGGVTRSVQTSSSTGLNTTRTVNAGVGYNLGDKDKVAASVVYSRRGEDSDSWNRQLSYGRDDVLSTDSLSTNRGEGNNESYNVTTQFEHKGDEEGENLELDFRISSNKNRRDVWTNRAYTVAPRPIADQASRRGDDTGNRIVDFSGDYERPLAGGILKTGFKASENQGDYAALYLNVDAANGADIIDQSRTNSFAVNEKNIAAYASYEWRLNEQWGFMPGLRTEYTDLDIHQYTTRVDAHNSYISYIPSMFVTYKTPDKSVLRMSYARRIQRPNVNDLNPFIVYRDDFNVTSGNPRLAPTDIDTLDARYNTDIGIFDARLRAYLTRESDVITERRYFISETVLLTTRDNFGSRRTAGLEFELNGRVLPSLRVSLSGNFRRSEQTSVGSTGALGERRGNSLSLRSRINYTIGSEQLQATVNRQGKVLSGEGYRAASTTADVSWSHKFTPRITGLLTVRDLFNSVKSETFVDTDTLRSYSLREGDGRLVYVGLSVSFGGVTGNPASRMRDGSGRPEGGPGGRGRGGNFGGGGGGGGGFGPPGGF